MSDDRLKAVHQSVPITDTDFDEICNLVAEAIAQNSTRMRELEQTIESYSNMVERDAHALDRERERVERLLLNLMPRSVYEEYKTCGVVAA